MWKCKITEHDITYGPTDPDEVAAFVTAGELMAKGYRKTSNAYCMVSRIDREDWLDVLAKERRCSRADFYNVDGSGVGDQHRDHYIRVFSEDTLTVHPMVLRKMRSY
jgi:hypothetical protein